jgi:hypothetical protein
VIAFAKNEGENKLAGVQNLLRIRFDDHIVTHWQCAGRLKGTRSLNLHQAEPASAVGCEMGVITQGWYVNPSALGGSQYCSTIWNFECIAVDSNGDHYLLSPINVKKTAIFFSRS